MKLFLQRIFVNTKCAYRLGLAGWLTGNTEISELERDRDFRSFAIDSIGHGGVPTTKILGQAPSWVPVPQGPRIYMSDYFNMGVDFG